MYCLHCGAFQKEDGFQKISFRAECESCGKDLHSCIHCKYYKESAANECMIPGIERVVDKTKANFCDEFSPSRQKPSLEDAAQKKKAAGKKFDDLFN